MLSERHSDQIDSLLQTKSLETNQSQHAVVDDISQKCLNDIFPSCLESDKQHSKLVDLKDCELIIQELQSGFDEVHQMVKKSLNTAMKNGRKLIELKRKLRHGTFKDAVLMHFQGVSYETCNKWMRISKNEERIKDEIERNPGCVFGITDALDFISVRKDTNNTVDLEADENESQLGKASIPKVVSTTARVRTSSTDHLNSQMSINKKPVQKLSQSQIQDDGTAKELESIAEQRITKVKFNIELLLEKCELQQPELENHLLNPLSWKITLKSPTTVSIFGISDLHILAADAPSEQSPHALPNHVLEQNN
jgi:hypothetical protein